MNPGERTAHRLQQLRLRRGWTPEELSTRSGLPAQRICDLETNCETGTLGDLNAIADALETTTGALVPLDHPLEAEWNTTAWDILSATARGFRAKVCVVGKLAEWKLFEAIEEQEVLQPERELAKIEWNDSDDSPDFRVSWRNRSLTIECKNVRRYPDNPTRLRVELQKTRNSKDGSNTRSYRRDKFDVLAACLYNQTREWRFAFCPTRLLAGRDGAEQLLAIYHDIPNPLKAPWSPRLTDALDEASR
jgi:transcriptional regulator with XRE-family HTH domain